MVLYPALVPVFLREFRKMEAMEGGGAAWWESLLCVGAQVVLCGFNIVLLSLSVMNWRKRGGGRAGTWERMTLPPLRLPPGTRRALVVFRSKDSRFWSGHYGAKLAAPVLAFAATDRELAEAEEAARETERGMEAAAAARELLFAA